MLIDTHAHLHFNEYASDIDAVLLRASAAGVGRIITVGVNMADSKAAVDLVAGRENIWATVGIHPHDANGAQLGIKYIRELAARPRVVAIGECGLDYLRSQTTREDQEQALRLQIELALEVDLPVVFHVRDAFDSFFKILDGYTGVRGVVHCFTGQPGDMQRAVDRGLYVGLNGIMTFTKDTGQLEAAKALPLARMLLETDCPYLTPAPNRGKRNEPAAVKTVAEFLASLRSESVTGIAGGTSQNAIKLFGLE